MKNCKIGDHVDSCSTNSTGHTQAPRDLTMGNNTYGVN